MCCIACVDIVPTLFSYVIWKVCIFYCYVLEINCWNRSSFWQCFISSKGHIFRVNEALPWNVQSSPILSTAIGKCSVGYIKRDIKGIDERPINLLKIYVWRVSVVKELTVFDEDIGESSKYVLTPDWGLFWYELGSLNAYARLNELEVINNSSVILEKTLIYTSITREWTSHNFKDSTSLSCILSEVTHNYRKYRFCVESNNSTCLIGLVIQEASIHHVHLRLLLQ